MRWVKEQIYWDFQLLDWNGDSTLSLGDVKILLQKAQKSQITSKSWLDFLCERQSSSNMVTWSELENWLFEHSPPVKQRDFGTVTTSFVTTKKAETIHKEDTFQTLYQEDLRNQRQRLNGQWDPQDLDNFVRCGNDAVNGNYSQCVTHEDLTAAIEQKYSALCEKLYSDMLQAHYGIQVWASMSIDKKEQNLQELRLLAEFGLERKSDLVLSQLPGGGHNFRDDINSLCNKDISLTWTAVGGLKILQKKLEEEIKSLNGDMEKRSDSIFEEYQYFLLCAQTMKVRMESNFSGAVLTVEPYWTQRFWDDSPIYLESCHEELAHIRLTTGQWLKPKVEKMPCFKRNTSLEENKLESLLRKQEEVRDILFQLLQSCNHEELEEPSSILHCKESMGNTEPTQDGTRDPLRQLFLLAMTVTKSCLQEEQRTVVTWGDCAVRLLVQVQLKQELELRELIQNLADELKNGQKTEQQIDDTVSKEPDPVSDLIQSLQPLTQKEQLALAHLGAKIKSDKRTEDSQWNVTGTRETNGNKIMHNDVSPVTREEQSQTSVNGSQTSNEGCSRSSIDGDITAEKSDAISADNNSGDIMMQAKRETELESQEIVGEKKSPYKDGDEEAEFTTKSKDGLIKTDPLDDELKAEEKEYPTEVIKEQYVEIEEEKYQKGSKEEEKSSPDEFATSVMEATESLIAGLMSLKLKVEDAYMRRSRKGHTTQRTGECQTDPTAVKNLEEAGKMSDANLLCRKQGETLSIVMGQYNMKAGEDAELMRKELSHSEKCKDILPHQPERQYSKEKYDKDDLPERSEHQRDNCTGVTEKEKIEKKTCKSTEDIETHMRPQNRVGENDVTYEECTVGEKVSSEHLSSTVMEATHSLIGSLMSLKEEVSRAKSRLAKIGKSCGASEIILQHVETRAVPSITQLESNDSMLRLDNNEIESQTISSVENENTLNSDRTSVDEDSTLNVVQTTTREVSWELHPECSKCCSHATSRIQEHVDNKKLQVRLLDDKDISSCDLKMYTNSATGAAAGIVPNQPEKEQLTKREHSTWKEEERIKEKTMGNATCNDQLVTVMNTKGDVSEREGCHMQREVVEVTATSVHMLKHSSEDTSIEQGSAGKLAMTFLEAADNLIDGLIPGKEDVGLAAVRRVVVIVADRVVVEGDVSVSQGEELSEESATLSILEDSSASAGDSMIPSLSRENGRRDDTQQGPSGSEHGNMWELQSDCVLSENSHVWDGDCHGESRKRVTEEPPVKDCEGDKDMSCGSGGCSRALESPSRSSWCTEKADITGGSSATKITGREVSALLEEETNERGYEKHSKGINMRGDICLHREEIFERRVKRRVMVTQREEIIGKKDLHVQRREKNEGKVFDGYYEKDEAKDNAIKENVRHDREKIILKDGSEGKNGVTYNVVTSDRGDPLSQAEGDENNDDFLVQSRENIDEEYQQITMGNEDNGGVSSIPEGKELAREECTPRKHTEKKNCRVHEKDTKLNQTVDIIEKDEKKDVCEQFPPRGSGDAVVMNVYLASPNYIGNLLPMMGKIGQDTGAERLENSGNVKTFANEFKKQPVDSQTEGAPSNKEQARCGVMEPSSRDEQATTRNEEVEEPIEINTRKDVLQMLPHIYEPTEQRHSSLGEGSGEQNTIQEKKTELGLESNTRHSVKQKEQSEQEPEAERLSTKFIEYITQSTTSNSEKHHESLKENSEHENKKEQLAIKGEDYLESETRKHPTLEEIKGQSVIGVDTQPFGDEKKGHLPISMINAKSEPCVKDTYHGGENSDQPAEGEEDTQTVYNVYHQSDQNYDLTTNIEDGHPVDHESGIEYADFKDNVHLAEGESSGQLADEEEKVHPVDHEKGVQLANSETNDSQSEDNEKVAHPIGNKNYDEIPDDEKDVPILVDVNYVQSEVGENNAHPIGIENQVLLIDSEASVRLEPGDVPVVQPADIRKDIHPAGDENSVLSMDKQGNFHSPPPVPDKDGHPADDEHSMGDHTDGQPANNEMNVLSSVGKKEQSTATNDAILFRRLPKEVCEKNSYQPCHESTSLDELTITILKATENLIGELIFLKDEMNRESSMTGAQKSFSEEDAGLQDDGSISCKAICYEGLEHTAQIGMMIEQIKYIEELFAQIQNKLGEQWIERTDLKETAKSLTEKEEDANLSAEIGKVAPSGDPFSDLTKTFLETTNNLIEGFATLKEEVGRLSVSKIEASDKATIKKFQENTELKGEAHSMRAVDQDTGSSINKGFIKSTDPGTLLKSQSPTSLEESHVHDRENESVGDPQVSSEHVMCERQTIALCLEISDFEESRKDAEGMQQFETERLFDAESDDKRGEKDAMVGETVWTNEEDMVKNEKNDEKISLDEIKNEKSEARKKIMRNIQPSEESECENVTKETEREERESKRIGSEGKEYTEEMEDISDEERRLSSQTGPLERVASSHMYDSYEAVAETQKSLDTKQTLCAEGTEHQMYTLPPGRVLLQREKVFFHLSVKEQQEAMQRLKDLQREAGIKCARDRRRQMLRFQERLSIARNRKSEEDLLGTSPGGTPQLSPEPLPEGDTKYQKTVVRERLERVKRERTYIMQTKRERNTSIFRELLEDPVLSRNECEEGGTGFRETEGL